MQRGPSDGLEDRPLCFQLFFVAGFCWTLFGCCFIGLALDIIWTFFQFVRLFWFGGQQSVVGGWRRLMSQNVEECHVPCLLGAFMGYASLFKRQTAWTFTRLPELTLRTADGLRYLEQLGIDSSRWAKQQVLRHAPLAECQIEACRFLDISWEFLGYPAGFSENPGISWSFGFIRFFF